MARYAPLVRLLDMLTYCRPSGSGAESAFIDRFIASLPDAYEDKFGNWHVAIGLNSARIMWSSHLDTVHRVSGRQTVHYDHETGIVQLSRRSRTRSACLGADCTAGVFIMCEMIAHHVPGHYVFHHAEEIGGIGSADLTNACADWCQTFDAVIAFDRAGVSSLITHQIGGRTASDAFCESLATALQLPMRTDQTGSFTDSANYAEHVGECTNVSVGYEHAHTSSENLNTRHVFRLLHALITATWTDLVIARRPGPVVDDRPEPAWITAWHARERAKASPDVGTGIDAPFWTRAGDGYASFGLADDADYPDDDTDDDDPLPLDAATYIDTDYARVQAALRRAQHETRARLAPLSHNRGPRGR